jgi:hypothetical protein
VKREGLKKNGMCPHFNNIPLEKEIAKLIAKISRDQHITPETLVNLWLKERLIRAARNKSSISAT